MIRVPGSAAIDCSGAEGTGALTPGLIGMDNDLQNLNKDELIAEATRLRAGIRAHRDARGHALCWHHPQLWGLLPEPTPPNIAVPEWPVFLRGCVKYRESLDRELPRAPRTSTEFESRS